MTKWHPGCRSDRRQPYSCRITDQQRQVGLLSLGGGENAVSGASTRPCQMAAPCLSFSAVSNVWLWERIGAVGLQRPCRICRIDPKIGGKAKITVDRRGCQHGPFPRTFRRRPQPRPTSSKPTPHPTLEVGGRRRTAPSPWPGTTSESAVEERKQRANPCL